MSCVVYRLVCYCLILFSIAQNKSNDSRPNTDEPVNQNEKYHAIFSSKLNSLNLLYGAEVDAVDTIYEHYVELKTRKLFKYPKQEDNFYSNKSCKVWIQSHLAGIPEVIYGERNDAGIVQRVSKIQTDELAKIARKRNFWSEAAVTNFLSDVLSQIQQVLTDENLVEEWKSVNEPKEGYVDSCVLKVEWNPRQKVSMKLVPTKKHAFLPQIYFE